MGFGHCLPFFGLDTNTNERTNGSWDEFSRIRYDPSSITHRALSPASAAASAPPSQHVEQLRQLRREVKELNEENAECERR